MNNGGIKVKILLIGCGGVGQSLAAIYKRRGAKANWLEKMVLADYSLERAKEVEAYLSIRDLYQKKSMQKIKKRSWRWLKNMTLISL